MNWVKVRLSPSKTLLIFLEYIYEWLINTALLASDSVYQQNFSTNSFKTESIRKLSNFNLQWTKTLYQNNFLFYIFQGLQMSLVICNKTKDYFSWEPKKINVKLHKNSENIGKILKIWCVRCHFFEIWHLFSRSLIRNYLWCYDRSLITSIGLEKCKKEGNIV